MAKTKTKEKAVKTEEEKTTTFSFFPEEEIMQVIAKKKIRLDFLFRLGKDPIGGIIVEIKYDETEENHRTVKTITDVLVDGLHVCDNNEFLTSIKRQVLDFLPEEKDIGKHVLKMVDNVKNYASINNIDLTKFIK